MFEVRRGYRDCFEHTDQAFLTGVKSVYVWSSFDTFIWVYTGESCDSMSCFLQERYEDRAVHFLAEDQQVYRILVGGANSRTGDFVVTVTEVRDCRLPAFFL